MDLCMMKEGALIWAMMCGVSAEEVFIMEFFGNSDGVGIFWGLVLFFFVYLSVIDENMMYQNCMLFFYFFLFLNHFTEVFHKTNLNYEPILRMKLKMSITSKKFFSVEKMWFFFAKVYLKIEIERSNLQICTSIMGFVIKLNSIDLLYAQFGQNLWHTSYSVLKFNNM